MTNHERTLNALKVMTLTPHIRAYLVASDPKALEQALRAISLSEAEIAVERIMSGTGEFGWKGDYTGPAVK